MNKTDKIHGINLKAFGDKKVVRVYSDANSLQKAEEAILGEIKDNIRNKKILDIGVGGGKTIKYLTGISSEYTGIDYSEAMVNACREQYPGINILHCDARDMSIFKNEEFDFILFTYNGIDCVSHADRLTVLKEIFRILKKGGCFVFSTHNRECAGFNVYLSPLAPFYTYSLFKPFTCNPVKIFERAADFIKGTINHWRNSKYVIHTDEYSIINDKGHDYSAMMYYISIKYQKEQLNNVGFKGEIKKYDKEGKEVINACNDTWIYYLVRK